MKYLEFPLKAIALPIMLILFIVGDLLVDLVWRVKFRYRKIIYNQVIHFFCWDYEIKRWSKLPGKRSINYTSGKEPTGFYEL